MQSKPYTPVGEIIERATAYYNLVVVSNIDTFEYVMCAKRGSNPHALSSSGFVVGAVGFEPTLLAEPDLKSGVSSVPPSPR